MIHFSMEATVNILIGVANLLLVLRVVYLQGKMNGEVKQKISGLADRMDRQERRCDTTHIPTHTILEKS